jgi:hypothetical protein
MYFISMMLGIVSVAIADTEPLIGIIVATMVVVAMFYFAKVGGVFKKKEQ